MASDAHRSTPERVPLFRSLVGAERGTLASSSGTEQRNDSGTPDLKALAERALSRIRSGTPSGTLAEREPRKPFRTTGTHVIEYFCDHIPEKARRHPANQGRTVLCCACFLETHPDWKPRGLG
jgi:hypothetical protein